MLVIFIASSYFASGIITGKFYNIAMLSLLSKTIAN